MEPLSNKKSNVKKTISCISQKMHLARQNLENCESTKLRNRKLRRFWGKNGRELSLVLNKISKRTDIVRLANRKCELRKFETCMWKWI